MLIFIIFIVLVSHLPIRQCRKHPCVPSTQFLLNGQLCVCDSRGWWDVSNCRPFNQRACTPGQTIWQGCSQCVCQDSGQLLCDNASCYSNVTSKNGVISTANFHFSNAISAWCTPYQSYYINCSICVCAASGRTADSHCAINHSCQQQTLSISDLLKSGNKNICIPKVMYLFPCLHCLCSDGGHFVLDQCVETCRHTQETYQRRCISGTFYRKNCNICWCPDDSVAADKFCTNVACDNKLSYRSLQTLKAIQRKCKPNTFMRHKCFYCTCHSNGNVNVDQCLESDCVKSKYFKYDVLKTTCSPGEMVPICQECLCTKWGVTNQSYCSEVCSYQSKLNVLEKILKHNSDRNDLIEREKILKVFDNNCQPNTIYLDRNRYCLCPENGSTNFKLCTSIIEDVHLSKPNRAFIHLQIENFLNESCDPNTFVEIDCNTCFCGKNGKIDPKWCTYDDCEVKRMVQYGQRALRDSGALSANDNETCVPGSIATVDCNFCICPHSGKVAERVCTKKLCSQEQDISHEKFACEPEAYYLVDCNVCLCPRDGLKNVEKCTKTICEKPILRSDSCTPGQLYSNECNICICPPNGDKADSACTRHKCYDSDIPWKKIFSLSQILKDTRPAKETSVAKQDLDLCFSGEEFEIGCKICVCPDVGLKSHATCSETMCDQKSNQDHNSLDVPEMVKDEDTTNRGSQLALRRRKRNSQSHHDHRLNQVTRPKFGQKCFSFNLTDSSERKECTPGSMYIIRCRQCICPYMGNINYYCRPLPKGRYCEQAYPNFNYLPMGRRLDGDVAAESNDQRPRFNKSEVESTGDGTHFHTVYKCSKPGRVLDECYICECEDGAVVEEHCFKSNDENCEDAKPTFLDYVNKTVIGFS